jgi:hypothetical protein
MDLLSNGINFINISDGLQENIKWFLENYDYIRK